MSFEQRWEVACEVRAVARQLGRRRAAALRDRALLVELTDDRDLVVELLHEIKALGVLVTDGDLPSLECGGGPEHREAMRWIAQTFGGGR
jgi:hypothetical protein